MENLEKYKKLVGTCIEREATTPHFKSCDLILEIIRVIDNKLEFKSITVNKYINEKGEEDIDNENNECMNYTYYSIKERYNYFSISSLKMFKCDRGYFDKLFSEASQYFLSQISKVDAL